MECPNCGSEDVEAMGDQLKCLKCRFTWKVGGEEEATDLGLPEEDESKEEEQDW